MQANYFDPEALLAEDTLVPCTFHYPVATMGQLLEPTCTSNELPAGSKVDVPLWIARPLVERNIAGIAAPGVYGERMRVRAEAGASVMRLRQVPYYYTVGLAAASLMGDGELAEFLRRMFADRFQGLLFTSLQAPDRRQLQEVLVKLNREEKQLYESGREAAAAQEQWWAAGGQGALLIAACRRAAAASSSWKKRRRTTEAAADKENVVAA